MANTIPIRTLVVDDSEFFAEMTAETLRTDHDIDTVAETSVEDALALLDDEPIDCIVSDYEMPDRDGLDFLESVREQFGDIPFILLTGRGDETIASEAIARGVADYLLKLEVVEDQQYGRLANRISKVVSQQRAQRKHELLVENSPDAIAQVAADGELLTVNPALAAIVDADPASLAGQRLQSVLGEVGRSRLETGRQALENDATEGCEDVYGERRYHNLFVPVDVREDRRSFQMISRDVTERVEHEREVRHQSERLETFASVVSHDLRNPLTVALSSLELIERDCDVDPAIADRVDRSLTKMEHIIDDVLALARQGRADHDPEPVSLSTVTDRAWENVASDGATVSVETGLTLAADPGRLQELLEHLFENASNHGGSTVAVEVGALEDGFYVADDGEGIPADDREHVFDLGFSTSQKGTGMGLSIVEQIAASHDWSIGVTAADSGGARFEITGVDVRETDSA
ncbi:response regulator [Halorhabdus sp. CBA1104]|uniref:response regulator n=1 Tax=Halorhabdus sp. CBA1104 TaxID=1380432 RepID=UPI0012B3F80F|nr:response regulator [Halorhabdus sp. CBA1104]QGN07035.1 response regulator [Halorhabdus sp. CBA1104]